MQEQIYIKIIGVLAPIVIGIIIFFLKDTMNNHKKHGDKIIDIEKNYVKKDELDIKQKELKSEINENVKEQLSNIKEDLKNIKDEVAAYNSRTVKSIDILTGKLSDIQLNYISKEDFLMHNINLTTKIDKLTDMLVEEKTKNAYKH